MIKKVYLAKCSDRNSLPTINVNSGSPEDWLSQKVLSKNKINGFTFDFFINWDKLVVSPEIWLKMSLEADISYNDFKINLVNSLEKLWSSSYIKDMYHFASLINLKLYLIIFDDSVNWSLDTSKIYKVEVKNDVSFSLNINRLNMAAFQENIKKLSGGPIQIGNKGLIYGTSRLECFLSKTDALYPGDADLILTSENNFPICLLEFKKHNLDTDISDENISKYYPKPDKKKYDRLYLLQQHICNYGFRIPILVLYFPTKTQHQKWKLEKIEMVNNKLKDVACELFDLPTKNNVADYDTLLNQILLKIKDWK